jgi:hypothetical protein
VAPVEAAQRKDIAGNGTDACDRSEHRVWLVVDGFLMEVDDAAGIRKIVRHERDAAQCQRCIVPRLRKLVVGTAADGNDANAPVNVVWSNSQPPVPVMVPGTTANQGLAALCFVSGDDTNTVSISLGQSSSGTQVQAFLGSVKMPVNTSGIQNVALPLDGQNHSFHAFTRFFAVPQSHWYSGQLQSDIIHFGTVQGSQRHREYRQSAGRPE